MPLVVAEDAIQFSPQSLNSTATCLIEKRRSEFDGDAVPCFKGILQHQLFAFRIDAGSLNAFGIPSRANFNSIVGGIDVHKAGHTYGGLGCVEHNKGQH